MVNPRQTRRRFLRAGGLAAVTAVVPTLGCDRSKVTFLETPTAPVEMPPVEVPEGGLPAELPAAPIISNDRFYLQSIKGQNYDPGIQAGQWSLAVDGLVERPEQGLRYEAITAMPLQRQVMTMQCIGNWIGGPLVGNAEWGGTPFRNLLDQVGVRQEAAQGRVLHAPLTGQGPESVPAGARGVRPGGLAQEVQGVGVAGPLLDE